MEVVKYECERPGYSVKQCRDRYAVNENGKPNPRENYFKVIELCGLDQLGIEVKNPAVGDVNLEKHLLTF